MRWPEPSRQPHTSASSCSREKTTPGRAASSASRSNSVGVRCTTSPPTRTRRAAGSISSSPTRDRVAGRRRPPLDPPQQRPHARDQLARRERLGHVVVGADGEPDEQVGLLGARGQHQHRHRPVALHAPADLEPVEPGQHQVEHDEVGPHALAQRDARRPVVRRPRRRSPRPAAARRPRRRSPPRPRSRRSAARSRRRVCHRAYGSARRILWRSCAEPRAMQLTPDPPRHAAASSSPGCALLVDPQLDPAGRARRRAEHAQPAPQPARASCPSPPRRSSPASTPCSSPTCTATTSTTPRASCCRTDVPLLLPAAGRRAPARRRLHRRAPGRRRRDARRPADRPHRAAATAPARSARQMAPVSGFVLRGARRADALHRRRHDPVRRGPRGGRRARARRRSSSTPSAARFNEGDPIVMDNDDVVALAARRRTRAIVAVHFETVSHCTETRADLHERLRAEGLTDRVAVPEDGARCRSRTRRGARARRGWSSAGSRGRARPTSARGRGSRAARGRRSRAPSGRRPATGR